MTKYGQAAISRETRLLLITIVVSMAALWLLARLRFQDRPVTAAPVVPVLAQLRPQSTYDDLARSLSQLRPGVSAALTLAAGGTPALRIGNAVGIGVVASHLELMSVSEADVPGLTPWSPRILDYPRYLVAAEFVEGNLSLRPVFVGSLAPVESRVFDATIWRLPPGVIMSPGTFVFTTEGLLAGVTVEEAGSLSLVPGQRVLESAHRLAESEPHTPGALGFSVQPTSLGVAVSWVDPEGPASRELSATDLIQSVNGRPVNTSDEWRAQLRSVSSGDEVKLRVRSEGEVREVTVVAAPVADRPDDPALGLHLRTLPRRGAEVLAVDPRSRGEHAGIRAGDVITVIGWQKTPTAHQVTRTFDTAQSGEKLLVALNRQDEHLVVVLEKQARATSTK